MYCLGYILKIKPKDGETLLIVRLHGMIFDGNQLRLYKTLKHVYETKTIFKSAYRRTFAKIRTGTAPITIE